MKQINIVTTWLDAERDNQRNRSEALKELNNALTERADVSEQRISHYKAGSRDIPGDIYNYMIGIAAPYLLLKGYEATAADADDFTQRLRFQQPD